MAYNNERFSKREGCWIFGRNGYVFMRKKIIIDFKNKTGESSTYCLNTLAIVGFCCETFFKFVTVVIFIY